LKEKQAAPARPWREVSRGWLTPVAAAVQFLTVIPPLVRRPFTPEELGRSVGWVPLTGVLLGGLRAGLALPLGQGFAPRGTAGAGGLGAVYWGAAPGRVSRRLRRSVRRPHAGGPVAHHARRAGGGLRLHRRRPLAAAQVRGPRRQPRPAGGAGRGPGGRALGD